MISLPIFFDLSNAKKKKVMLLLKKFIKQNLKAIPARGGRKE